MVITALMMRRQRALVRTFEQAGATSVAEARTAEQLGLQPGMAWYRLVAQAVLRCPGEGRYFLDRGNWQRLRQRQRWMVLVVVALFAGCLGLILLSRPG